jgi:GNAT superfamily N-acetyltransferase
MDSVADLGPQLANFNAYWLGYGVELAHDGGLAVYRSGVRHPELNGVLRLSGRVDEAAIMSARTQLGGIPWIWWVGPDSAPGLAPQLLSHGAVAVGRLPLMAIDLDRAELGSPPSGLRISEVVDDHDLGEWAAGFGPSMGVAPDVIDAVAQLEARRTNSAGSLVRFAGHIDGQFVGSCVMLDMHGVAGIYIVTCAESHRRRGIGRAMSAAGLLAGRERGLRFGTLQATEAGVPLYQRMGFEAVADFQIFELPQLTVDDR